MGNRRKDVKTRAALPGHAWLGLSVLCVFVGSAARAQIVNGGFQTGDFTGWTRSAFYNPNGGPTSGNPSYATFLSALAAGSPVTDSNGVETFQSSCYDGNGISGPPVVPLQGTYMAFLSNETAAGDGTLTGSSISQTFVVPAHTQYLSFNTMLLNNDDPSDFVSFDDFGGIALTQGSNVLDEYDIDLNTASTADAHVSEGVSVGGFVNSTSWLSPSFDVSGLDGQTVTLTAYVLNYGDNNTESRILLDNVQLGSATVNISGTVTLQGSVNEAQSITFQIQPTSNLSSITTQTVTLNSSGAYTLTGITPGTYNIAAKGDRWLQAVVPNVNAASAASGVDFTLLPGDLNGDNQISLADLLLLLKAYGSTPNSSDWNPVADLNCDGQVSLTDLLLLLKNYGAVGQTLPSS
jgi:hypothetical protein